MTGRLSRERIVAAAVALLDDAGESGLTIRALTERLATGPGTIYWHVPNRAELLGAATESVVAAALGGEPAGAPRQRIRAVALGLYDAIDAHPWLGPQLAAHLSHRPDGSVTPRILESIGRQVQALAVPADRLFVATSALMLYIFGAAGQNAANARAVAPTTDRAAFLGVVAKAWTDLDPDDYPFTRSIVGQMRAHDDREQFLGGIDLILAGITATS